MLRRITAAVLAAVLIFGLPATATADQSIDSATNDLRTSVALPALPSWNPLQAVAQQRAGEISANFAHPSDWQILFDRLPSCLTGIGENIAYSTSSAYSTAWVTGAWWASPEHHANIVGTWDWQGSATIVSGDKTYAVQLFAKGCTSGGDQLRVNNVAPAAPAPPVTPALPDTAMESPQ